MAAVVAALSLSGHLSLGPLLATPCEGLLEGGKAASFAAIAMAQVAKTIFFVLRSFFLVWLSHTAAELISRR